MVVARSGTNTMAALLFGSGSLSWSSPGLWWQALWESGKRGFIAFSTFPSGQGPPFFFASFFFTNNPHFLRLFRRFGRLPPGAGSLFGRSGAVAFDGQLQDHRVMHDAIDGSGRGHGVLEDLIP